MIIKIGINGGDIHEIMFQLGMLLASDIGKPKYQWFKQIGLYFSQ